MFLYRLIKKMITKLLYLASHFKNIIPQRFVFIVINVIIE